MASIDMAKAQPIPERLQIPPGSGRGIRFGAIWTMAVTAPYFLLFVVVSLVIVLLTGVQPPREFGSAGLEFAGKFPAAVVVGQLVEGLQHVVLFVSFVTLFAALRRRWPVRASLILVFGAAQMIVGTTKVMIVQLMFIRLGDAYVHAGAAAKAAFLAVAAGAEGLRLGLQSIDGLGVSAVLVMLSLLPRESRLPRVVRWLGWGQVAALLLATPEGPTFFMAMLLLPFWAVLVGRWLKQLATGDAQ